LSYIFKNNIQILKELGSKCDEVIPYQSKDCPLSFKEAYETYKDPVTADD
jgi:hypothetical protein